jgi:outer membrane lipoprotein-sorting protein
MKKIKVMKKRSLVFGLGLLLAALPMMKIEAQAEMETFALASNLTSPYEKSNVSANVETNNDIISEKSVIEKPGKMVFFFKEDVLNLSYINEDNKYSELIIKDNTGLVLYSDYLGRKQVGQSRLATTKLPMGDYVAVFKSGKESYELSFAIEK